MPKRAVSVTLESDNLLWLRGQAQGAPKRSLSEILDRLVTEARTSGRVHESAVRSVVGSILIPDSDPDLSSADAAIRSLFPRRSAVPKQMRNRTGRGRRG